MMEEIACSACGLESEKIIKRSISGKTHWFCCPLCMEWFGKKYHRIDVQLLRETMLLLEK